MRVRPRSGPLLALFFVLALAACAPASPGGSVGGSEAPASASAAPSTSAEPSPTPAEVAEPLLQALDFVPLNANSVAFTDWVAVKASLGVPDLTSASPLEERQEFARMLSLPDGSDAAFSFFAAPTFFYGGLASTWGFDTTDLDWEASIRTAVGNVYVLHLRDGFDLAPVVAHFDEREFATTTVEGVTVRSHDNTFEDWVFAADPAFLNVALMPDGRTLVLAAEPEELQQVLAQRGSLLGQGPDGTQVIRDTVAALEQPSAAWLAFSLDILCNPLARADPDIATAAGELLDEVGPLHPYTLVALGYRPDLEPTGRIVFGYVDAADAAADLPGRRRLATEGVSLELGAPIENRLFSLVDATVDDGSLILRVGPPISEVSDPTVPVFTVPWFMLQMTYRYDLLFAACDISL